MTYTEPGLQNAIDDAVSRSQRPDPGDASTPVGQRAGQQQGVQLAQRTPLGHLQDVGDVYFPAPLGQAASRSQIGDPRDGGRRGHKGLDLFAPQGSPIVAPVGGTIRYAAFRGEDGFGWAVSIVDDAGNWHSLAHMDPSSVALWEANGWTTGGTPRVEPGQVIGYVGDSGNAKGTGYHVHYSINEGHAGWDLIDPFEVLTTARQVAELPPGVVPSDPSGGVAPARSDGTSLDVPSGGRVVRADGYRYLEYRFGGQRLLFTISPLATIPDGTLVEDVDPGELADGIVVGDLALVRGLSGDLGALIQETLDSVLAPDHPARNDPEVAAVLFRWLADGDSDPETLQTLLEQTDFWRRRSETQLAWESASPGQRNEMIRTQKERLVTAWSTYMSDPIGFDDPRLSQWASAIASGSMGYGQWVEEVVKPLAEQDPQSPWSRSRRDEARNRGLQGVSQAAQKTRLRDLSRRWGVRLDEGTLDRWASDIYSRVKTEEDFRSLMVQQAQVLYPWKTDPDVETVDAAQAWLSTYRRVMERDATLFDPAVASALQEGLTPAEFERRLKKRPDWLETNNARDEITAQVSSLGRQMGFV